MARIYYRRKQKKRHTDIIVTTFLTLLFIYLIVYVSQNINYLLGNELIVNLRPLQKSIDLRYGESEKVNFEVSIENVAYCMAHCEYSFNDRSSNSVIEEDEFKIAKDQLFRRGFNLSVNRLGSGQDLYNFDIQCSSIRSFFCLTKGFDTQRSSLVTVNYDLSEAQEEVRGSVEVELQNLLTRLNEVDVELQKLDQKYFEIGFEVNLINLSTKKIDLDDKYDKLRIEIENLRSLWEESRFEDLEEEFSQNLFVDLEVIKGEILELNEDIDLVADLHNSILLNSRDYLSDLEGLSVIAELLGMEDISLDINSNFNKLKFLIGFLDNNDFEDYDFIEGNLDEVDALQSSIIDETQNDALEFFVKGKYYLNYQKDYLCSLTSCEESNSTIIEIVDEVNDFVIEYPESDQLKQSCDSLIELENEYYGLRNESLEKLNDVKSLLVLNDEDLDVIFIFADNKLRELNNSYVDRYNVIKNESAINVEVSSIANSLFPKNKTTLNTINNPNNLNLTLYALSEIDLFDETKELVDKCKNVDFETKVIDSSNFSFNFVEKEIDFTITNRISTDLFSNPATCCVFNECKPCCKDQTCKDDPKTFPVILLHGHAFSKSNSPEFSLDAFNSLQSKLQEDGYINAGIVSLYTRNEPLQKGIWGLSGRPITVKASYYFDTVSQEDKYIPIPTKSESIDTYALRLREIIDLVKMRTNKPKVNIVSHSMGGLVTRRYMQVFGIEDINKFVMIGTPNHGIEGTIADLCGIVGENRECKDMKKGSLFLNKLNDENLAHDPVDTYNIIGTGCKMDEGTGDGVVLVKNARLNGAREFLIEGDCAGLFDDPLHTEMLDIHEYGEIYETVRDILAES